MRLTAKQAAERLNISYVVASGLMSHLEDVGKATVVEKVFHASGKGKPTRVYEVENNVVLNFGEDILQTSVVESEAVAEKQEVQVEEIVPVAVSCDAESSEDGGEIVKNVSDVEEIVPIATECYYDDDDEDEDMAA
jgi:hypothetical protein